MAWDRLSGLHRIDEIIWEDIEDEPGVYLFYKTWDGPCRYVGRSDTNLRRRIAGRPYKYFRYKHTSDEIEAYSWECQYYHRYIDTIDNINHPGKPWGYTGLECPVCGL